jgi:CheY-like chemotaxis protein
MEAVGQLAGGIAHDFNNLLTVITGYNQLLQNQLDENARARGYAREIMQASERASSLTRQLLAFSRRQIAQPQLLDLNTLIINMRNMLTRLVGDSVQFVLALSEECAQINADPVQVEQIVLNLAVNARDAMPDGGRLTIETTIVDLTPDYLRAHVSAQTGPHVMLAVTDTGQGMNEQTRLRVFEPFFTTKDIGKGTGLGLSTVYGIVQQNNATIWVYSEVGLGSTFKVYFPLAVRVPPQQLPAQFSQATRGTETVLLVEHEPGLRSLIEELLVNLGYTVLAVSSRAEAEETCRTYPEAINLMLSDVVMPDVTGQELAHELLAHRPAMRLLYMSGYPGEAVVQNGLIGPATPFLQKPFSQDALGLKIRQVLEG